MDNVRVSIASRAESSELFVGSLGDNSVKRYDGITGAYLGDFVPPGSGGLRAPFGFEFGPDGNLYVTSSDTNSVKRYSGDTGEFLDDFVPPGRGGLIQPIDLTFGPDGNLYVDSRNDTVLRYNGATGAFLGVFASGTSGRLVFGPDNNLYVSEFTARNVRRYNGATGAFLGVFASEGLQGPLGLAFGPDGNLYVGDNRNPNPSPVQRFDGRTGAFLGSFVSAGSGGLRVPLHLAFGPDGNLYVTNANTREVLRYNGTTGAFIDAFIPAGSGGLNEPYDIVFHSRTQPTKPETTITSNVPQEGATTCTSDVEFCFAGISNRNPVAFTFKWRLDGGNGGAWQDAITSDCITLKNLSDGTHTFEVFAIDDLGNEDPTPAVRSFRVDATKPVLSDVQATPTPLEATITWKTNEAATSQVEYGTSTAYGATTPLNSTLKTGHSVKITGLTPNTTYHYRVRSKDACGHETISGDFTFTAPGVPDLQVPAAGAPAEVFTDRSFEVSWTVANRGSAAANPVWADKVFLSADAQLGGDTQLEPSFAFEQALEPGGEAPRTQTVSIPRSAVPSDGDYYLIFLADANNNVNEANFENNNFRAVPIRVRRTPLPDLLVDAVEAPDSALFGQTISVRWTVRNAGPAATDAAGWNDRVYLSTRQTLDADAVQLAETTNVSYLNAGESYVSSANVGIPRGIFGTYYLILVTDSRGNVSEENENNNTRTRAIQIQVAPVPDLQAPLVQGQEEGFAGEPIVVSWRVENKGTSPTPPGQTSWTDHVFVSRDAAFNGNAQHVGSFPHTGALAPNEGYDVRNQSVTLPRNASGDYYVYVVADADNRVYEYVFENNNVGRSERVVRVQSTPPDLAIQSVVAPGTGEAGRNVTVRWVVKNQGAFAAVGNWTDSLYLSRDPALDTSKATLLGSVGHAGPLGAGLTYEASRDVRLPECLTGPYYLFVVTDSGNTVAEFDPNFDAEKNNTSDPAPTQLSSRAPDLRVPLVVAPGSGVAGQAVPVSWTVTNAGAGETLQTSWTDRVYLSRAATFDGSAVAVGNFGHSGALAAGAGYSRTENVVVPLNAEGAYYVHVSTDATGGVNECEAENNNVGSGALVLNVQPPPPGPTGIPDLLPSGLTAPDSAYATDTVTVTWTGGNQGTREAPASGWNDGVYLVSTNVFNPNAGIGNVFIRGPLAVGASYPGSASVQIPRVSDGTYFLFVKTDSGNNVAEGAREDNNTVSRPIQVTTPPVDLQVTSVSIPGAGVSGQSLRVTWTVTNAGTVATRTGNWTDYVFLSRDQVRDSTDRILDFAQHSGALAAGASYTRSLDVTLPGGLSGPYYVLVYTDRNNAVAETNENNNIGLASTALPIQLPALTDLAVTAVGTFPGGMPGGIATIVWTIANQGPNPTTGAWADAVYLSADATWDIGDILIGRQGRTGPLAVGASYNGTLTTALPSLNPGPYYVIVRTDILNSVRETDETNNIGVSGGTGAVDITELQPGVPHSSALGTGAEHYFKVFVPAGETLRIRLDGANGAANEMYVRHGAVPSRSAYQFFHSRPYEPDQEIVVPTTNAGWYYILVRGDYEPVEPTPYTILAELLVAGIQSVVWSISGDNGETTVEILGAKLSGTTNAFLQRSGATVPANDIFEISNARINVRFPTKGLAHGAWDVVVKTPQGDLRAPAGLVIEPNRSPQLEARLIGPGSARIGRPVPVTLFLHNLSNVNMERALISIEMPQDVEVQAQSDLLPEFNEVWDHNNDTIVDEDGRRTLWLFVYNIAPNRSKTVNLTLSLQQAGLRSISMETIILDRQSFSHVSELSIREGIVNGWLLSPVESNVVSLQSNVRLQKVNALESDLGCPGFEDDPSGCADFRYYYNRHNSMPDRIRDVHGHVLTGTLLAYPSSDPRRMSPRRLLGFARFFSDLSETVRRWREFDEDSLNITGVAASDPNDKIGPSGFGPQAFIGGQSSLPYTINFENVPTATAAAQRIRITDQLDPDLDWRTFRLKEIGFNNYRITVPDNRSFFQTRMPLGPDLGNLLADITASVNIATGEARWTLTAIDPATGEQPLGANQGLLPPNDETHRGEGYVTFTVQPKAGLPTGTGISNQATITFDVEEPIITNTVANTLDGQAPSSAVAPLPAASDSPFTVSWTATDDATGSGVQSFDIWVSDNDGPYAPFVSGTVEASAAFTGLPGHTYRFYSIARDNAGNVEAPPNTPDAVTTVTGTVVTNPVPQINEISPGSAAPGEPAFTLTVTGAGFVPGSTVRWNGQARPTVFLDSGQLTAQIPATDIAAEGTAQVTVFSPGPGGGTSNAALFVIGSPPPPPPLPQITGLSPDFAQAGGPAFTLTVSGSGFVSGSTMKWNGQARPTEFVSANQLTASIPAGDIAAPGTAQITVENPAPNAATSNTMAFRIDPAPADTTPPTSSVAALPAQTTAPSFLVTWSGQDEPGGSGLKDYDIYVSDNNAAYTLWRSATTATSDTYTGTPEHTYRFYSRARDNAGNVEPAPSTPDAVTTVSAPPPTDTTPPTSMIAALPAQTVATTFTVTWSGQDEPGGSGLKDFDVYVSDNNSAYTLWQSAVTEISASFTGQVGHTYRFYSIARDNAGNVEAPPDQPDAVTTVSQAPQNPVPILASISPSSTDAGGPQFTLTVTGTNFINGCVVRWNGQDLATTFVSATQLTAIVPASRIANSGTASVTVFNPAPGGGTSNALTFTIDAPCARDVSAPLQVVRGGFRYVRATERFVQQVMLKNIGNTPIAGPVSLALDGLSGNATLFNKTGLTGCATPAGSPYLDANVGGDGALGVGEAVTLTLEFTNPSKAAIGYTTRVLAGPAPR